MAGGRHTAPVGLGNLSDAHILQPKEKLFSRAARFGPASFSILVRAAVRPVQDRDRSRWVRGINLDRRLCGRCRERCFGHERD